MKLADEIKYALMRWCKSTPSDIIVPNFFINTWYEMDLFKLTKAGYVTEYEIKISKSDFKNDFKKSCFGKLKHDEIKNGERVCNYFYFVVPEGLLSIDEVPDYCGIIEYNDNHFETIRRGKKLHSNKYNEYKTLAEKMYFRLCNHTTERHYHQSRADADVKKYYRLLGYLSENNIKVPYELECW